MKKQVACDEPLFSSLKESKTVFDLVELSGKVRKDVWILSYSVEKRLAVLSDGSVKFQDIARLNFKGKNAVKFFKEVLPQIPESPEFKFFEGKPIYIYPYGSPFEKWNLVRACSYFFILHRSKSPKGGKKTKGKPKKTHEYSVVYKLSLSAVKPFFPIKKELILEGEPVIPHEAGNWREGAKKISSFMIQEFRDRKTRKIPVVLALKDGREIRGILKNKGLSGFYYVILNPQNPKEKTFVFKHAVDDFWIEEKKNNN
jgi:sRNA-binding regulator protein Hfq